ncbi:MAG: ATP-binding protein [Treponema sp.]|nr:ATP-binding protein [Treponema sp.]
MILGFTLENMFSIKTRQTISFEVNSNENDKTNHFVDIGGKRLLKIIALFGPNAAGKSNMLHAFDSCFRFIMNGFTNLKPKEDIDFRPFLFDEESAKKPGYIEIVFLMKETKYEYLLTFDKNCVHKESLNFFPKGQRKLIYERLCKNPDNQWEKIVYDFKWGDIFTGSKLRISSMTRPNVTFINTAAQLHHPLIQEIYNWLEKLYLPIIIPSHQNLLFWTIGQIEKDEKQKKALLSFLTSAGFDHIKDIIVTDEEIPTSFLERLTDSERAEFKNNDGKYIVKEIFITHQYKNRYNLPVYDESRGTQRLLELSGPLLTIFYNKMFLCIDEIEASLHADLQEFLITTFLNNSSGSQIIFTTHNQALMDLLSDESIWLVEKGKDGGSNYKCLAHLPRIRKITSRKKLYKEGKLGALPETSVFKMNKGEE